MRFKFITRKKILWNNFSFSSVVSFELPSSGEEVNFGMTVRTDQFQIFRATIQSILVLMMYGKDFWNIVVSAFFTAMRSFFEQPFFLSLRRTHRTALEIFISENFSAFFGACFVASCFNCPLPSFVLSFTNGAGHDNVRRMFETSRDWMRSVFTPTFPRTVFSCLGLVWYYFKFFTTTFAGFSYPFFASLMRVNESAWASKAVVVARSIYKRLAASARAELRTFSVFHRALPKRRVDCGCISWHGCGLPCVPSLRRSSVSFSWLDSILSLSFMQGV